MTPLAKTGGRPFYVISPEFPMGAAWLANCLFELGIYASGLWGFETHSDWAQATDGSLVYSDAREPWRQTLAALRLGRRFLFREGPTAIFSHAFPWQLPGSARFILVVRDPRDALHSEWQRRRTNGGVDRALTFRDFVQSPFRAGAEISVVDILRLHLSSWLAVGSALPERMHILRFEDFKAAPVEALQRVACWIGIAIDDAAAANAAAASDVAVLQAVEAEMSAANPRARVFNRRGQAFEWRATAAGDWQTTFDRRWRSIFVELGYELPAEFAIAHPDDLDQQLRALGLCDDDQRDCWRAIIGADRKMRVVR